MRRVRRKRDGDEFARTITRYETTVGRALLSEILPKGLPFDVMNKALKKKEISQLINAVVPPLRPARDGDLRRQADADRLHAGDARRHLDRDRRHAGAAAEAGDHSRPPRSEVKEIEQQYTSGLVTQGERYNKVVDIWGQAGDHVGKAMMDQLATEHGRSSAHGQRRSSRNRSTRST